MWVIQKASAVYFLKFMQQQQNMCKGTIFLHSPLVLQHV
jgi:hypothetical protein